MPFMLYNIVGDPGREEYTFEREVRLAGKSGPLAAFALAAFARKENRAGEVPFGWHTSCDELVPLIDLTKLTPPLDRLPRRPAIVIDLKPRVEGNVSLYRLLDVWGFSSDAWTPLALRLQALFVDREVVDPHLFKSKFIDEGTEHSFVGEFLYLQGGVSKGTWNWGMVGRVNGALLWREAFDFLVDGLDQSI